MKSLQTYVNEAIVQPRELGHESDGLFELIALNSDKSLINNAKNAKDRLEQKAASVSAALEKINDKK